FTGSGTSTVIGLLKGSYATLNAPVANAASTTNNALVIATGLTYQLALSTGTRKSLTIQNNQISGTDVCYLIFGQNITGQMTTTTTTATNLSVNSASITAGAASLILNPGQPFTRFYPYVPNDPIYVTCTTTGDGLYVDAQ